MKKTKVIKAIVNTLIFLILFCSVDIFFKVVYKTEDVAKNNLLYIIPSILVYTLFYGFTLSILKNTKKTNLIISIIFFILLTVNHIKILTSGNTLFISDFEMISNAGEIATLSFSTLANVSTYIPLIILAIIFIILNIVSNKVNIQLKEKRFSNKKRIAIYSSPDFLLNYVVNNIDIQISDYYKWVYDFQKDLPATNKFISFSNDEKVFLNQDLPNDLNEKYELRKNMQYMLFR